MSHATHANAALTPRARLRLGRLVIDQGWPIAGSRSGTTCGRPLTYQTWRRVWLAATKASQVDVDTHALRHLAASALISGGASVKQVQTVLGHSSAAITLRVYSHMWPGDDERIRSVMDGALVALADEVRTQEVSS